MIDFANGLESKGCLVDKKKISLYVKLNFDYRNPEKNMGREREVMMSRRAIFCVVFSVFLMVPSTIFAGGFSIFEQGAAATGMAGAFSARADDPSAVFYNPAGIVQLDGLQVSIGATLIAPDTELTDPYGKTWDADDQVHVPPTMYITGKLNDRVSLGFGVGVPFGLGMEWDNNKNFIYRHFVEEVDLWSIYFNPVVAIKINDNFSFGGGLMYVRSDVEYTAAVDMSDVAAYLSQQTGMDIHLEDGRMKLDGDNESGDYGFNLGLQARFNKFRFGLVYRSEVDCTYDGDVDFTVTPTGYGDQIDSIVEGIYPDTKGRSKITMPASASLGIAYDFSEKFSLEFDLNWMDWSSYKNLPIDFEYEGLPDINQPKNWDDAFSYRLGARYRMSEALDIYAGYLYDETPIPDETLDPILPDADRHSVQVGLGYTIGVLKIDASYMALFFKDRGTSSNIAMINGDYENFSHLVGLQLTYLF